MPGRNLSGIVLPPQTMPLYKKMPGGQKAGHSLLVKTKIKNPDNKQNTTNKIQQTKIKTKIKTKKGEQTHEQL